MKIKAVIFDWAGTVVDFGSFAPVDAFVQAFAAKNIKITMDEVRKPMGMLKRDHIKAILDMPRVNKLWQDAHKKPYTDKDINAIHDDFEKHLMASLLKYNGVIDGVLDTVAILRKRGLKIGSTTGYTQKMMAVVVKDAKQNGYAPDSIVTPDEVGHGRPYPHMIYQNMKNLNVFPASAVVKVGDTASDIEEGINAGAISVGVAIGSSMMGLTKEEFDKLSKDQQAHVIKKTKKKFLKAGAHYVIKDMTKLPKLIDKINKEAAKTKHIPENPYLLLTPGPLSTSKSVKAAMLRDWCTWDADYNGLVQEIRRGLVSLATTDLKTYSDYTSVLMQGSGTFCVESVIGSVIPKSGKLLVLANGAYGKRIGEIAHTLGIKCSVQDSGETAPIDMKLLKTTLEEDAKITHVAVVHCETTTGMLNDIEAVGKLVKAAGKVYIVDAMSSFGGIPIDMARVGADFMISSANKCIQGVPGFGFIIAKTAELAKCSGNARSLSLDLFAQWDAMEKGGGKWRFTSPTHVVRAFYEAMLELEAEGGAAKRYMRYNENQRTLVNGMAKMGFKALLPKENQSPIITSFYYPNDKFSFEKLYYALKNKGFIIYPGKISEADTFRIGNIGEVYKGDIMRLLTAIEAII